MGGMECYERDFEAALLSETSTYYKRKAALWIDQVWRGGGVDRPEGGKDFPDVEGMVWITCVNLAGGGGIKWGWVGPEVAHSGGSLIQDGGAFGSALSSRTTPIRTDGFVRTRGGSPAFLNKYALCLWHPAPLNMRSALGPLPSSPVPLIPPCPPLSPPCHLQDSCPDYMIKAEECLKDEDGRVDAFLHASSKVQCLFV